MAAVTVNEEIMTFHPGHELVDITTAADADTYVSRKLSRIVRARFQSSLNVAATDAWSTTFSGRTVTIQLAGTTAVSGLLEIWGSP